MTESQTVGCMLLDFFLFPKESMSIVVVVWTALDIMHTYPHTRTHARTHTRTHAFNKIKSYQIIVHIMFPDKSVK